MALQFQDPEDAESPYLLESLLQACDTATSGGGIFAWASATGLNLLLRDPTFSRFAKDYPFELVIGLDLVTDERALKTIVEISAESWAIKPRVFLHDRASTIFHPKTCWFRTHKLGGVLISGSGNLTVGGLRSNWEAYSVTPLSNAETTRVEADWHKWLVRHSSNLVPPDTNEVLERAAKNAIWNSRPTLSRTHHKTNKAGLRRSQGITTRTAGEALEAANDELIAPTSRVLVAEIPRGSNRWNQANFSLKTYEGFFGAKVGTQRRILLQHVEADGSLEQLESRPSVEVKSRNFRFELHAASGKAYPQTGRPTGVFIRQLTGVFVYRLVMPGSPEHEIVGRLLGDLSHAASGRMRRVETNAQTLRQYWPDAPFWKIDSMPE